MRVCVGDWPSVIATWKSLFSQINTPQSQLNLLYMMQTSLRRFRSIDPNGHTDAIARASARLQFHNLIFSRSNATESGYDCPKWLYSVQPTVYKQLKRSTQFNLSSDEIYICKHLSRCGMGERHESACVCLRHIHRIYSLLSRAFLSP